MNESKYLRISDITKLYPFSLGTMRFFLMHRKENGLNKAVLRVGKSLLINREKFEKWIESHHEKTNEKG